MKTHGVTWRERPYRRTYSQDNLDDPVERKRLTKVFEAGLNAQVGSVLPPERGAVAQR